MIWLIIAYMMLYIHRPFEIWTELSALQTERVCMIIMLVCALISGKLTARGQVIHVALAGFVMAVLLSWMFSPWRADEYSRETVITWLKIVVFYLVVVLVCNDRRTLELLIIGLVAAIGLYVSHSVLEYQRGHHTFSMGVSRLIGINVTFKHANSFAIIALMGVPYAVFLIRHAREGFVRMGAIVYIPLAIYGVFQTGSRAGIVGLLLLVILFILKSKRKFSTLVIIAIAGIVIWPVLPESKQNRILSLYDETYAPENAQKSAEGRIQSFWDGVALYNRFPITGAGPGSWRPALHNPTNSHNLYGQLLGEVGLIGTIAFTTFVLVCLYQTRVLRKCRERDILADEDAVFYSDLGVAFFRVFAMMLLLGMSGGSLLRFYWIWNAAFVAVAISTFRTDVESFQWNRIHEGENSRSDGESPTDNLCE